MTTRGKVLVAGLVLILVLGVAYYASSQTPAASGTRAAIAPTGTRPVMRPATGAAAPRARTGGPTMGGSRAAVPGRSQNR